ncbi:MAG: nicotinate (nicotinamide) nucleotide adenylyltransferase [Fusobacteriaceae bacterium]
MKIGIFGGSFNPPHIGHQNIAKLVLEKLDLDKLFIIPVGVASHRGDVLLDGDIRFKMCRLTFENLDKKIELSDIETSDKNLSYTYDTLMKFKQKFPEAEFFEIIGEDSAQNFCKWKNFEEIFHEANVVVVRRKKVLQEKNISSQKIFKQKISEKNYSSKFIYLDNSYYDFSSTEIRAKILRGESVENFLVKEVFEFIKNNELYTK